MDSSSDEDFVSSGPSTSISGPSTRGRIELFSSSEPPAKTSKSIKAATDDKKKKEGAKKKAYVYQESKHV